MLIDIHETEEDSRWLSRCAWGILVAGLLCSVLGWWRASDTLQQNADAAFVKQSADVSAHVDQLIDHYVDVLRSFQAMYLVSDDVKRSTFHQQYTNLDVPGEYPALLAIQFAKHVTDEQRAAFEASVRADHSLEPGGYPDYQIKPAGARAS